MLDSPPALVFVSAISALFITVFARLEDRSIPA